MASKNFIGSMFLVSGCSMGAGSLALPLLAAGPNFLFSALALIAIGGLSYLIARVSLEIFMLYQDGANGSTIALANFGKSGAVAFALLNGSLMYALLSVYMSGSVDLFDTTIAPLLNFHLSAPLTLLLLLIIAAPIFIGGAEMVVKSNKIVFALKLVFFLVALALGLKFISLRIFSFESSKAAYLPKALPIFLAALWFHFLIPVIARLNDYNRQRCLKIFAYGISLPVILYIVWVGVMLSLLPRTGSGNTFFTLLAKRESVGAMVSYATHEQHNLPDLVKYAINAFANTAMITSFLSVGISTYDYLRDAFKIKQNKFGISVNFIFTMLPPAIFALFYPHGFVFILQQAAILLMLINIFTLLCCLKAYSSLPSKPAKLTIYFLLASLSGLIGLQFADNFSLLPSFGIN